MYNKRGGGDTFRIYNSCNLAWWHTYKHASLMIWRRFAPVLIAPMWHTLYPRSIFPMKPPRLAPITTHLMYLFHAYPKLKDDLDALEACDLEPRFETLRKDIKFMFEFAIPVVS